jgi:hypothetical protein
MQNFRLIGSKFLKTITIFKSIYKNEVQCKIKMKIRMSKLSLGKKKLQPKNDFFFQNLKQKKN